MVVAVAGVHSIPATARPYVPANDTQVLAELPAGARHAEVSARRVARARLDVALPLAQFYINQSRASGDLRFLGYAEAVLVSWVDAPTPDPAVLVLQATIQQSRHEFEPALMTLDRAIAARRDSPQAWLTRATVLRVMGRYAEAEQACLEFARLADPAVGAICRQGVLALHGNLAAAYDTLLRQPTAGMGDPENAWRDSELGEMAVRLGNDRDAERWFQRVLALSSHDFYVRAAYADLLLRQHRPAEVLVLLKGQDSIEPLLLRIAIAQRQLRAPELAHSRALLVAAFATEALRGEAVHRREQARYLLDVAAQPQQALEVALRNWQVQREPDDALVVIDAARAAGTPQRAAAVRDFLRAQDLRDARLVTGAASST
jgi:predicted Zn-dependent protease